MDRCCSYVTMLLFAYGLACVSCLFLMEANLAFIYGSLQTDIRCSFRNFAA